MPTDEEDIALRVKARETAELRRRADTLAAWGSALLMVGSVGVLGVAAAAAGVWASTENGAETAAVAVGGVLQCVLLIVVGLIASGVGDVMRSAAGD